MQSDPLSNSYVNNGFSEPAEVFNFLKGANKHTTFWIITDLKFIYRTNNFSPHVVTFTLNTGNRGGMKSRRKDDISLINEQEVCKTYDDTYQKPFLLH